MFTPAMRAKLGSLLTAAESAKKRERLRRLGQGQSPITLLSRRECL
jgi:hypothetical protein